MKWLIMAYSPSSNTPYLYEINDETDNVMDATKSIMSEILKDNKDSYGVPTKLKAKFANGLYQLTAIYSTTDEDDIPKSVSVLAKSEKTLSIKYPAIRTFPDFDDSLSEITAVDMIANLMS